MPKVLLLTVMLISTSQVLAMTQVPLSIQEQLQDADVAIRGHYQGHQVRQLPNGDIITEHSFYLVGHAGFKNKDLINHNDFKVHTLGGVWRNENHLVPGMASFEDDEEVVLLLKKGQFAYNLSNNTLSKYSVSEKNGTTILRSALNPTNPQFGEMDFDAFQFQVFKHFGERIALANPDKSIFRPRTVNSRPQDNTRRLPANHNECNHQLENQSSPNSSLWERAQSTIFFLLWPMVILALLGTLYHYTIAKKRD